MPSMFRFPKCVEAYENTQNEQIAKVLEETYELAEVNLCNFLNTDRLLEEAWDVIHAVEGIMRKYPIATVATARDRVEQKNRERGYYD